MNYIKFAKTSELKIEGHIIKTIYGKRIVLIRESQDDYHAVECSCKHQGANLLESIEQIPSSFEVSCPRHGWKYSLRTGECLTHSSRPLKIFPVLVEEDTIFIQLSFDHK